MALPPSVVSNLMYVGVVLGLLVLVALLSCWGASSSRPSPKFDLKLKGLLQEAQHWAQVSAQDANPLLALTHATYAMAYLRVARSMASDADIERACNLRLDEFAATIADAQQAALRNVTGQCPSMATPGLQSINTGWLADT